MYPEDRSMEQVNKQLEALQSVVNTSLQNADEAPERIAELTERLAEAVFQAAMGRVDADEPKRIRAEIARLEVAVEDARYIAQRAEREQIRLNNESQKLSRRRAKRSELLELQSRLTKEPDTAKDELLIQRMRDLAEYLDGSSDAVDKLMAKVSASVSSVSR